MLTVHIYTIRNQEHFSLELPQGAKILTVREEHGGLQRLQIWALVNTKKKRETRNFLSVRTGNPIKEAEKMLNYIGTYPNSVGHLFELK